MAIEAISWGKPVIAAAHGGLMEIIERDKTGLLFRPCDRRDLVTQLDHPLSDEGLRCEIGQAGRAKVKQCFFAPAHADAVHAVYHKVLTGS